MAEPSLLNWQCQGPLRRCLQRKSPRRAGCTQRQRSELRHSGKAGVSVSQPGGAPSSFPCDICVSVSPKPLQGSPHSFQQKDDCLCLWLVRCQPYHKVSVPLDMDLTGMVIQTHLFSYFFSEPWTFTGSSGEKLP